MTFTSHRHVVRALALVLCLTFGLVLGGLARPALAASGTCTIDGLTFTYTGDTEGVVPATESPVGSGLITLRAPAGMVAISGTSDASFTQIVVAKDNRAAIELNGVHIDELNSGSQRHTVVIEGATELTLKGTNEIYADKRYSALWTPNELTIAGSGSLDCIDSDKANAAISIIAKDLTIGEAAGDAPTIEALLMAGTLYTTGVTQATGTLTVNGGTVTAESTANYQQAISAGTFILNDGSVTATISGRRSDAVCAKSVRVLGGSLTAKGTGDTGHGIAAGSLTVAKGGTSDPVLDLQGTVSAVGCPVVLRASSADEQDFYPWLVRGGTDAKSSTGVPNSWTVRSFAGAGNATTAATSGITFDSTCLLIERAELTKLSFTPAADQSSAGGDYGVPDAQTAGLTAGDRVYLDLTYTFHIGSADVSDLNFGSTPLTTFFPVKSHVINPAGNATAEYAGGTQGCLVIGSSPTGRTTSIEPRSWGLLDEVYGTHVDKVITPCSFPMKYDVTFYIGADATWTGGPTGPVTTKADGTLDSSVSWLSTNPTLTDHTFSYWQIEGGGIVTDLASHVFNADTTLTAVYAQTTVNVTFNVNDGTWPGGTLASSDLVISVPSGGTVSAPATPPARSGFVFLGWYTGTDSSATPVDFTKPVSTATTYYAQWGRPGLAFASSSQTVQANHEIKLTVSATAEPETTGLAAPTPVPTGLTVSANPPCSLTEPKLGAGKATFTLTAPPENGVIDVTAAWEGATVDLALTVTGGTDTGDTIYLTFQGNGGTWDGSVPFKTIELTDAMTLSTDQIDELGEPENDTLEMLAWYEWIVEENPDGEYDDEGNLAPVYGHWHSVDLTTKEFTESETLTAMWADQTKSSLILWPLTTTVEPRAQVLFTAALLPQPLETGVLPPYDYKPKGNDVIDATKLSLACVGEDYGTQIGAITFDAATNTAQCTVTAPSQATPADSNGVVLRATYTPVSSNTASQLTATATLSVVASPRPAPADTGVAVSRLYLPGSGAHLLTADKNEIDVLTSLHGWKNEGVKFYLYDKPAASRTPITRLYNPSNGDHIYTAEQEEIDALCAGQWVDEGVKFYGAPAAGHTPVYRLWNASQTADGGLGSHLWTADENEYAKLPTLGGWRRERAVWYAVRQP